ncbi:DUF3592 domain-containing protein [Sphingomonas sp. 2R-10]|uniref:DUF3592 domain-containing protein n=1 Tax=Sphingomonas sp. 2R-10 TaxID=3045148 RepID=UPI0013DE2F06|nr:DUF3592 domain-containing protein [Sphingomonas sp. 2R-10]MDJ0277178.1 DUF3592 domain-containing protein [Sphingomonas sp. 2R-10]
MRAIFFAFAGGVLLVVAVVQAFGVYRYLQDTSVVAGTVVATPHGGSHPVVRFATAKGNMVTFPGKGWIGGYAVGDSVSVRYDPRSPRIGPSIDTIGSVWAGVIVFVVLGAGFLVGGLLVRKGMA